jgi:hypothetical protein
VRLSAEGSTDPDGDPVDYEWFQYREAGSYRGTVDLRTPGVRDLRFTAPQVRSAQTIHLILSAKDRGRPSLYAYRRVIVTVEPEQRRQP